MATAGRVVTAHAGTNSHARGAMADNIAPASVWQCRSAAAMHCHQCAGFCAQRPIRAPSAGKAKRGTRPQHNRAQNNSRQKHTRRGTGAQQCDNTSAQGATWSLHLIAIPQGTMRASTTR